MKDSTNVLYAKTVEEALLKREVGPHCHTG